jgi:hypothetical protein
VVLLVVLAGCSDRQAGTLAPDSRGSELESVELEVVVAPDGAAFMTMDATFASDAGGILPVPRPIGATAINVTVDGERVEGSPSGEALNVEVDGRTARAQLALTGTANAYTDITTIEIPVLVSPSDATRQDPPVEVSGTVTLPVGSGPGLEAQWNQGLDREVSLAGRVITFSGESPVWTSSSLAISGRAGILAQVPPDDRPYSGLWTSEQRVAEQQTEQLESTLDAQDRQAQIIDAVIVAIGVGISLLMVFQFIRLNTSEARDRRRRSAAFTEQVVDPPDDLSPALVALIDADGHRVDREGVAGTLLDLAHRRLVGIDGFADQQFVLRLPDDDSGTTVAERIVLDALRHEHPSGEVTGPPVWGEGKPGWWPAYRREVLREGREAGLVRRRFRVVIVGPFAAGIVAATWPFWAADRIWLVPIILLFFGLLFLVPLGGGFETTERGFAAACRWRAFGRYAEDHGSLGDVGAAGVVVWGPYLSYGAVLGSAPLAARDLSPQGLPERTTRADRRQSEDDEEAGAGGSGAPDLGEPLEPLSPPGS